MLSQQSPEDAAAPLSAGRFRIVLAGVCLLLATLCLPSPLRAENGYDAWLRYSRVDAKAAEERYADFPATIVALGDSECVKSARDELIRGVRGMLGQTLRSESKLPKERAIILGTFDEAKQAVESLDKLPNLSDDGFWLKSIQVDGQNCLIVIAPNDRGVLYGVFELLRKIDLGQPLAGLNERHVPAAPVRMVGQWDGLDGTTGRDYTVNSIFWDHNHATTDLDRVRDYARLLASVGINGLSINNPNAGGRIITPAYLKELAQLSGAMRPYGVQLFIALNSANPPAAASKSGARRNDKPASWDKYVEAAYAQIPDLGGFVIDADWNDASESPETAQNGVAAVNALAATLKSHNGVVLCRTCACALDANRDNPTHDAAKTAYEMFQPLDGQLHDNVIVQIKHGPTGLQVREPPSPLFAALEHTNQAVELEITQEYLGQQRHLCFLVPKWKQALEFNVQAGDAATPVKEIVAGKTFKRPTGGFVAVANARRVDNWLDHDLAMANLYGFGRLAWDPNLTSKAIAEEWTRQSFGHDPLVVGTIVDMLQKSWRIYESYTGPLGVGTFNAIGDCHYGPGIESPAVETGPPWHSADATGIGTDRTAATGTGFVSQYRPAVAERFEAHESCPDELLLFIHHVPYSHTLHSGKTVIQHIYDAHYQGAKDAAKLTQQWQSLKGRVDDQRYEAVLRRLQYQAGHAQLWRDAVCNWFLQTSGVADSEARVGNYPNRFEAEAMQCEGFAPQTVTPWETASGGQCAECTDPSHKGAVSMNYDGKPGWYNLRVRYFDESDGASKFRLLVAGQLIDKWTADDTLPDNKPNGHTSTRHESARVALRTGDEIRIEATADAGERAAIDYLEIDPAQEVARSKPTE